MASLAKFPISTNILDEIDSPTYHFRLFAFQEKGIVNIPDINDERSYVHMHTLEEVEDGKVVGNPKQLPVLIAETGASRVGLDNIEINYIPAHSPQTGTGQATTFTFDIIEPGSVSFFDELRLSAISLGNDSYTKCSYYLELTFLGRSTEHQKENAGSNPTRLNQRWIYPIHITKVTMSVDSSGAQYASEAVIAGDIAHQPAYGAVATNFKAIGKNAREILFELEKFLNVPTEGEDEKDQHINVKKLKNKYYIFVDEDLQKKLEFNKERLNNVTNSEPFTVATPKSGEKEFSWEGGIPITSIIDNLLSITDMIDQRNLDEVLGEEVVVDKTTGEKTTKKCVKKTKEDYKLYKIITKSAPINYENNLPTDSRNMTTMGTLNANLVEKRSLLGPNVPVPLNPESNEYSQAIIYYITNYDAQSVKDPENDKIMSVETSLAKLQKVALKYNQV